LVPSFSIAFVRHSSRCGKPIEQMFPNAWDTIGGHVEPRETLLVALEREVQEETGWTLDAVEELVLMHDWTPAGEGVGRREFDFLVTVNGDLAKPVLETRKVSAYRWIGHEEMDLLLENRPPSDQTIRTVVDRAFLSKQR
jgi:8-oxo-dGTP pyrophosphatase MutT (NUDIX family)